MSETQVCVSHIQPLWLLIPVSESPNIAMTGLHVSLFSSSNVDLLLLHRSDLLYGLSMPIISQITLNTTKHTSNAVEANLSSLLAAKSFSLADISLVHR